MLANPNTEIATMQLGANALEATWMGMSFRQYGGCWMSRICFSAGGGVEYLDYARHEGRGQWLVTHQRLTRRRAFRAPGAAVVRDVAGSLLSGLPKLCIQTAPRSSGTTCRKPREPPIWMASALTKSCATSMGQAASNITSVLNQLMARRPQVGHPDPQVRQHQAGAQAVPADE